jgi:hypothetical protein
VAATFERDWRRPWWMRKPGSRDVGQPSIPRQRFRSKTPRRRPGHRNHYLFRGRWNGIQPGLLGLQFCENTQVSLKLDLTPLAPFFESCQWNLSCSSANGELA